MAEQAETIDLTGCRILVVEDEYFIVDDVRRAFERRGAEVVGPAPDLAEGLALARREALDGAVLDIHLQGEHVFEIAEELNRRGVPFVYATGYEAEAVPPALRNGLHLVKPVAIDSLVSAVSTLCRRGRKSEPG